MKKFLLSIGLAIGLLSASEISAQNNPFNPDFAWCNNVGAIAVRGPAKWQCLQPSPTVGLFLRSTGTGSVPDWAAGGGGGGGTVSSVAATVPSFMSLSGSPITTTGTLAFGFNNQAQNSVLAGPSSGGAGAPTFRALTAADLSALTLAGDVSGNPGSTVINAQTVTNAKMATMPANRIKANNTGSTATPTDVTLTALLDSAISNSRGAILYRGASNWSPLAPGVAGQILQTNGAGADPAWSAGGGIPKVDSVIAGPGISVSAPTGNVTISATGGAGAGFKNRFENGDFNVFGNHPSTDYTAGATVYSAFDRYFGTATTQPISGIGFVQNPIAGFPIGITLTGVAGNTGFNFGQRIESNNIQDLAGTAVTVSFYVSCTARTSLTWKANSPSTPADTDTYAGATLTTALTGSITGITSTMARKSATFTAPPQAVNGMQFYIEFGAFASGSCTFTGWQLESGSSASDFERMPQAIKISRAQRYAEILELHIDGYAANSSDIYRFMLPMKSVKRTDVVSTANTLTPTNCTSFNIVWYGPATAGGNCTASAPGKWGLSGSIFLNAEIY